ncbi:MAG: hypothetical protein SGILL_001420 [Bacillariaceae sp.]
MFRISLGIALLALSTFGGNVALAEPADTVNSQDNISNRNGVILHFPTHHDGKSETSGLMYNLYDKFAANQTTTGSDDDDGSLRGRRDLGKRGGRDSKPEKNRKPDKDDYATWWYGAVSPRWTNDAREPSNYGHNRRVLESSNPPGGSVVSNAVQAMQVDKLREKYPFLTGANMKIGVLSSGFNTRGGADDDVASGDLPFVTVTREAPQPLVTRDDGRAMLQLIHDVAPEAQLYFHSVAGSPLEFPMGIERLADEGCDVIVDDVRNLLSLSAFSVPFFEPWFQEGIVTQTANDIAEHRKIPYFSAAGNSGMNSWESKYRGVPCPGYVSCHDFGGGSFAQRIVLSEQATLFFQWDDPWVSVSGPPGAATDFDVLVFDPATGMPLMGVGGDYPNTGEDALELVILPPGEWDLVLAVYDGTDPTLIKWIITPDAALVSADPPTNSGTIVAQAKGKYVAGIGASEERQVFSELLLEPFSSVGGTPFLFNRDGSRMEKPLVTNQPRFVGPDGSFNTFFGLFFDDPRPDVDSNFRFYGTSAAVSNIAAVALLLKQANPNLDPSRLYEIMEETAIDMNDKGFDFESGYGMVNALAAADMAMNERGNLVKTKQEKKLEKLLDGAETCSFTTFDDGSKKMRTKKMKHKKGSSSSSSDESED